MVNLLLYPLGWWLSHTNNMKVIEHNDNLFFGGWTSWEKKEVWWLISTNQHQPTSNGDRKIDHFASMTILKQFVQLDHHPKNPKGVLRTNGSLVGPISHYVQDIWKTCGNADKILLGSQIKYGYGSKKHRVPMAPERAGDFWYSTLQCLGDIILRYVGLSKTKITNIMFSVL